MSDVRRGDAAGGGIRPDARIVAGSLFALVVVGVAAAAAWPIYRSASFALLVIVAAIAGAVIAGVAFRRRWRGWRVAGVLAAALLVLGVPLAVPSRLGAPADWLRGLADLATGLVFAWKDLITVELPVGAYRNLLVPALVVFLVGTCALLLLSWRADAVAYAAVPVALGMVTFGLVFGRATVSAPLQLGPLVLHAPLETAIGAGALLAALLWLAWRTHDERVRALRHSAAAAAGGARIARRSSGADRRRTALGAGMVAAALVVAVAVVPFAARGAERDVLRSAVGPDIDLTSEPSPLAGYRALFADDRADDVLFTVAPAAGGEGALPERIRLATLDSYDGEVFRSGGDGGRFVRVPSGLDAGTGTPVAVRVEIGDGGGIWMPTAGRVQSVEFDGGRAAALADGFYYSAAAAAGVQTAGGGLRGGDAYVVRAVAPDEPALAALTAPGAAAVASGQPGAPGSLRAWIGEHTAATGGAALAELVALLRARGYLSHGLTRGEALPKWAAALPDYAFQPSASGHSLARVDAMFARLLEREADPRAAASGNQVAAVGDDEQFAVAVALMARELGFPARVVLGARLSSAEPGLATCDAGVCRAQDLAAWTEVQSADGRWVAVDATPQYAQSPSLDVTEQRDPENVTEARPDTVEEVVPPDPTQEDSAVDDEPVPPAGPDLAWLVPILRAAAIALLVVVLALGPFLVIVGAKAARRRSRRTAPDPVARIAGGWDEYVDAARDAGREMPRASTRTELAAALDTPDGAALAREADRAVFSRGGLSDAAAEAYWSIVDAERGRLRRGRGFWRGLVATVSLRSLLRPAIEPPGVRPRIVERRRRRAVPVRPLP